MKRYLSIFCLLATTISTQAMATDDTHRTIAAIGAQTTTSAYVRFNEGLSQPCIFGLVFLGDMSQPMPKAMLATLLSAKTDGSKVSVISYEMGSDRFCTATKVEIE